MSWLSELANKAETLLNNIDERTASALQNPGSRHIKTDVMYAEAQSWLPRQTRRPFTRPQMRKPVIETRSNYSPTRKSIAPIRPIQKDTKSLECRKDMVNKSPVKKPLRKQYDLNNAPQTMVSDGRLEEDSEILMRSYGASYRRKSLPSNKEVVDMINRANRMEAESHDVENEMLKNEVSVCNKEVSDLLDKMKKTEDELEQSEIKYNHIEKLYNNLKEEKESLISEMEMLKEKLELQTISSPEYSNLSKSYQVLEADFSKISERNRELQEKIQDLEMTKMSNSSIQIKLENDLRFAHMTITDLQSDLEKSRSECQRIQNDWDSYKLRVKSMLLSKDKEIQALQKGLDNTEGTKMLIEQVESLREEREELSCVVARMQGECADTKAHVDQLESRANTAERLVTALREALREERLARNKAENVCVLINKELKNLQMESSHQISNLRNALREKENDLQKYNLSRNRSITSVCPVSDGSTLNVAEQNNRMHDTISSEKVQLLTQSLITKQGRIDALLADNNTLKLQVEKIEARHRLELSNLQSNQRIIQVTDGDAVLKTRMSGRNYVPGSTISKVSLQIGVFMRRHPLFRLFIVIYMAGLHLWVLVVLLTYTPEIHPEG